MKDHFQVGIDKIMKKETLIHTDKQFSYMVAC